MMNPNFAATVKAAAQNPAAFCQKYGLPQNAFQNPQQAAQALIQSGRFSQDQINSATQMMQQAKNDPQMMQMFSSLFGR